MSYGMESVPLELESMNQESKSIPHEYSRPKFLNLTPEQYEKGRCHAQREILFPSDQITQESMPWNAGYAEVINAGKSENNEDQSWLFAGAMLSESGSKQLRSCNETLGSSRAKREDSIPVVMFGVCDGHAGWGAAVLAVKALAARISERLEGIKHFLFKSLESGNEFVYKSLDNRYDQDDVIPTDMQETVTTDSLISGALEECFREMDDEIRRSLSTYDITGGCTCLVVLVLMGKVYVANAGDCRAILVRTKKQGGFCFEELSQDHTPLSDRQRVQSIAFLQPELLGEYYGRLELERRARKRDLDKNEDGRPTRLLFRDAYMRGWARKEVIDEDVNKIPMVIGRDKRARLLSTIGTTRGLGDHDLTCQSGMYIKPFMTSGPEVIIYKLTEREHSPDDVIVLASDGLWECLSNWDAVETVSAALAQDEVGDPLRYRNTAMRLVRRARGENTLRSWRLPNDEFASMDDISCFVIPVYQHMRAPKTLASTATIAHKGEDVSGFMDVDIEAFNVKGINSSEESNLMSEIHTRRNDVLLKFETSAIHPKLNDIASVLK